MFLIRSETGLIRFPRQTMVSEIKDHRWSLHRRRSFSFSVASITAVATMIKKFFLYSANQNILSYIEFTFTIIIRFLLAKSKNNSGLGCFRNLLSQNYLNECVGINHFRRFIFFPRGNASNEMMIYLNLTIMSRLVSEKMKR